MKTVHEVEAWRAEATARGLDPAAAVCHLFVKWVGDLDLYAGDELAIGTIDGQLALWLGNFLDGCLPLDVEADGPRVDERTGELCAFGAIEISEGVWALTPSLNMRGQIHGFVVLYGLPAVPPWQRRLLLPPGLEA